MLNIYFLLYLVSQWSNDSNGFEMASLFVIIFVITFYIFILSEPGTKITNQFLGFCDEFDRCDWYLLPISIQRMYLVFLSDTQHPIMMHSYANITCERETSKKVIQFVWKNSNWHFVLQLHHFPDHQHGLFILYDTS